MKNDLPTNACPCQLRLAGGVIAVLDETLQASARQSNPPTSAIAPRVLHDEADPQIEPRTQINGLGGPVYRLPGGVLAIPTGRMFIRFQEGERPESHRDAVEAAGFLIAQVPSYAPDCAWVTPKSGYISDALRGIANLKAIAHVENVEPQMLSKRALK